MDTKLSEQGQHMAKQTLITFAAEIDEYGKTSYTMAGQWQWAHLNCASYNRDRFNLITISDYINYLQEMSFVAREQWGVLMTSATGRNQQGKHEAPQILLKVHNEVRRIEAAVHNNTVTELDIVK